MLFVLACAVVLAGDQTRAYADEDVSIVLNRKQFCNPAPFDCAPGGQRTESSASCTFTQCSCSVDGDDDPHPGYAHYQRISQCDNLATGCIVPRFHIDRWGDTKHGFGPDETAYAPCCDKKDACTAVCAKNPDVPRCEVE
jgi:hypothetical protein